MSASRGVAFTLAEKVADFVLAEQLADTGQKPAPLAEDNDPRGAAKGRKKNKSKESTV